MKTTSLSRRSNSFAPSNLLHRMMGGMFSEWRNSSGLEPDHRASPAQVRNQSFMLEALEPRLLLSATPFAFDAGSGLLTVTGDNNDNIFVIDQSAHDATGSTIKLTLDGTVSQTYTEVKEIQVNALDGNDSISLINQLSVNTIIDGGAGNNTISGPTTDSTWNLTGAGEGTVGQVNFSGVTNLVGGSGNDTYHFGAGSLGSFFLDETAGGVDTVDLSARTSAETIDLSKIEEQTIDANLKLTLSAVNVFENVIGSATASNNITGNELDNIITAGTGADVLVGGFGDDTYVLANNWGTDTITEGGNGEGTDTIHFTSVTSNVTVKKLADGTFTLSDDSANSVSFGNIEVLQGGTGVNSLDFSLSTSKVVVNLAGGVSTDFSSISGFSNVTGSSFDDTIIGDDGANMLHGGDGNDTISGGAGADVIDGGAGTDQLVESRDVNFTLTNVSLTATGTGISGSEVDTLAGIESAQLDGGASANVFDASQFTGSVTLDGGSTILLSLLNNGTGIRRTDLAQMDLQGTTLLSSLNQGDGVHYVADPDFRITLTDGKTVDVNLTPDITTIQGVIDAIESAANAVDPDRLSVVVNPDTNNSLLLTDSNAFGGDLSVTALNGSSAAADLGILRTGSGASLVGLPVSDVSADLRVTLADGSRIDFDLSGASTFDDVLQIFNGEDPRFTVRINSDGTGLTLHAPSLAGC